MSLLDQASLVLVPSAYRTGEVLVQKPLPTKFSDETGNYDGNDPQGSANLTFTRNSNASRVNADGKVERVRTNLLRYSQDFSNAAWVVLNTPILTSNYATNPLTGENNAWRFQADNDNDRIYQTYSGSFLNFSIYAKGSGTLRLRDNVGVFTDVTLTANWQRVSIHFSGSISNVQITTGTSCDATIYAAQLETGDIATDYIPTTTSARSTFAGISVDGTSVPNVPRLDYSGGACPSLLLEPQCSALNTYSEAFGNAYYVKYNITVSENQAISPSGYQNADKIFGVSGQNYVLLYSGSFVANTYSVSIFVKAAEYTKFALREGYSYGSYATFDLTQGTVLNSVGVGGGTVSNAKIEAYSNGWYRCSAVFGGTSTVNFGFIPLPNTYTTGNPFGSYTADGTSGVYIWGYNVTQTSYLQSYVPTLGASVTRLADAASKTGISSLIGQTEGTIFLELEFTHPNKGSNEYLVQLRKDSPNRMLIYRSSSTQTIGAVIINQGTTVFNSVSFIGNNTKHKIALAYKSGDMALYIDGSQVSTSTNTFAAYSLLSDLDLGINNLSGTPVEIGDYDYNQALLFKTRLSNADLANLTAL